MNLKTAEFEPRQAELWFLVVNLNTLKTFHLLPLFLLVQVLLEPLNRSEIFATVRPLFLGKSDYSNENFDQVTWLCENYYNCLIVIGNLRKVKVAQGIRLCLPFCCPRFESQSHHLHFFQFIKLKLYICHLNWNVKRTKIYKKRRWLAQKRKILCLSIKLDLTILSSFPFWFNFLFIVSGLLQYFKSNSLLAYLKSLLPLSHLIWYSHLTTTVHCLPLFSIVF